MRFGGNCVYKNFPQTLKLDASPNPTMCRRKHRSASREGRRKEGPLVSFWAKLAPRSPVWFGSWVPSHRYLDGAEQGQVHVHDPAGEVEERVPARNDVAARGRFESTGVPCELLIPFFLAERTNSNALIDVSSPGQATDQKSRGDSSNSNYFPPSGAEPRPSEDPVDLDPGEFPTSQSRSCLSLGIQNDERGQIRWP